MTKRLMEVDSDEEDTSSTAESVRRPASGKRPQGRPMFTMNMTTSDKVYGRLCPFGVRNMITRPRSPAIYGHDNMIGRDKHVGELHGA